MSQLSTVKDRAELLKLIQADFPSATLSEIEVTFCYDPRIGWQTFLIMVRGEVWGMANRNL